MIANLQLDAVFLLTQTGFRSSVSIAKSYSQLSVTGGLRDSCIFFLNHTVL